MSYKNALIFILIVQCLYFSPILIRNQVIFPHDNSHELSVSGSPDTIRSNRKFSDQSSVYIPEINQHLNSDHRAWLSTWNPYTQLGRPTQQLSGFSRAFLLSNILSFLTNDPFWFYTLLTVFTVSLTSIFCFFFLKSIGSSPMACSSAALGLSLGVFVSYWLTFVMFISTICWSMCLLWLISRYLKHQRYTTLIGISFAVYSLLLTGFPQFVVAQIYMLTGFTLIKLYSSEGSLGHKASSMFMLFGAAMFGLTMASPVYIDLLIQTVRCVRFEAGDDFFVHVLPKIGSLRGLFIYIFSIFDAFWAGIPIEPGYRIQFEGLSLSPLYFLLFTCSFFNGQWRKLWPWQLFSILCFLATVWPPAYLFAVRYMGFHLSRVQLLASAFIPAFILSAYSIDSILKNGVKKKISLGIFFFFSMIMATLWYEEYEMLQLEFALVSCLILTGTVLFMLYPKPLILQILVLLTISIFGQNLMLTRPRDSIHTSSVLIETIQSNITPSYRYAKVGKRIENVLPSNQESLFKFRSIHSYDSLSSRNYQRLVLKISDTGTRTLGRYFYAIDSDSKLDEEAFSYLGVDLVLSSDKLDKKIMTWINEVNGINLYKPIRPSLTIAQISNFEHRIEENEVVLDGYLDDQPNLPVTQIESQDDFKSYRVTPVQHDSVLFINQQYHPRWKASANGHDLDTVIINDFYQGAIIPSNHDTVILEFKPAVVWSIYPQLFYTGVAIYFVICRLKKSRVQLKKTYGSFI
jgi:hypothetical protein